MFKLIGPDSARHALALKAHKEKIPTHVIVDSRNVWVGTTEYHCPYHKIR